MVKNMNMGFLNQKAIRKTRRVTAIATAFFLIPAALFFVFVFIAAMLRTRYPLPARQSASIAGLIFGGNKVFMAADLKGGN